MYLIVMTAASYGMSVETDRKWNHVTIIGYETDKAANHQSKLTKYLLNQISSLLFTLTLGSLLPTLSIGTLPWPFPIWELASDDIFVEKRDLGNHIDSAEAQYKCQYGHNGNWKQRMNEKMWQPNPF